MPYVEPCNTWECLSVAKHVGPHRSSDLDGATEMKLAAFCDNCWRERVIDQNKIEQERARRRVPLRQWS